uniref:CCHC-type domain-containing protein n=1 Tax=Tanacetum cinerariifolium TaxID=118510 RepID=A0A6L2NEM9_TANCI|nr:hypothetical protein [Tanacetum cinerariifolium]
MGIKIRFGNGGDRFDRGRGDRSKGVGSSRRERSCYGCGNKNHFVDDCRKTKEKKALVTTVIKSRMTQHLSWRSKDEKQFKVGLSREQEVFSNEHQLPRVDHLLVCGMKCHFLSWECKMRDGDGANEDD